MLTLRAHGIDAGERGGTPRRTRATVISVGLHLLLLVGLWQVLQFPRAITFLLGSKSEPPAERLRYFAVAPPATSAPATVRGPVRQPSVAAEPVPVIATPPAPTPSVVAPAEVPIGIPPAPTRPPGPTSGPLVTGQGAVKGVQPGFTEPRIWIENPAVTAPALEGDAKLDSAVTSLILAYRDSVAANTHQPNKYERGDWTYTTKDGKKYGIDQQYIRLGRLSIPTALLGLLPMNQMQNPIAADRDRRLAAMRMEIIAQAQQAMNEEEFRRAVKQIHERKERERKEAEKKKKKEVTKVISDE